MLEVISERAHLELVERYDEELAKQQVSGLRSGAMQGALLKERSEVLVKAMKEESRVIVDAAMQRWRLWMLGFTATVLAMLLIGAAIVYVRATTPAEYDLARAIVYTVGGVLAILLGLSGAGTVLRPGGGAT